MTRQEAARQGGRATLAKHGREHFRAIGKAGYRATLARYWQGDALAYRRWLIARGWNACMDQLADRELDRQLAEGAEVACVEIDIMTDEDGDLPY